MTRTQKNSRTKQRLFDNHHKYKHRVNDTKRERHEMMDSIGDMRMGTAGDHRRHGRSDSNWNW